MIKNTLLRRSFKILKKMDWVLLVASFIQLGFGVLFIFCIGHQSGGALEHYWIKQSFWITIGLILLVILVLFDYRQLGERYGVLIFGFSIFLLLIVLIPGIGLKINGARSWIKLPGIGTLQPSEFAKPAILLFASWAATRERINLTSWHSIAEIIGIFLVPIMLIAIQPDFGSCVVFIAVLICLLFINGIKIKFLLYPLLLGILLAPFLFSFLKPHQKDRINVFIHPITEPFIVKYATRKAEKANLSESVKKQLVNYLNPIKFVEIESKYKNKQLTKEEYKKEKRGCRLLRSVRQREGYNVYQSFLAVGSGGLWGKGFLNGTQNELGFLPQKVAPTDFIFSVIAEELGFFGSVCIILIYLLILFRVYRIAQLAPDRFGRVMAMVIGFMFFVHLYINLGMTMGIAPVIGIPLPFMSYGGSFVVSAIICLGLLQSVYVRRSEESRYMIDDEK